jgi:hypothetical protein
MMDLQAAKEGRENISTPRETGVCGICDGAAAEVSSATARHLSVLQGLTRLEVLDLEKHAGPRSLRS